VNDFAQDPLARRLARLEPRVDADDLSRRVLARARAGRAVLPMRLRALAVAVPLALVASVAISSYYFPAFAQALADAPVAGSIAGPVLRAVGLVGVPSRIIAFGDTLNVSGYRVDLLGGYADAGRTILFLRTQPAAVLVTSPRTASQELSLTDQFGRRYRATGAIANSETGENTIIFEPLLWPASAVGARLHLSFNTLVVGAPSAQREIAGRWDLTGTLAADEGADLPVPPGGSIGEIQVAFTRLRSTRSAVIADLRIEPDGLDLGRVVPDAGKGHSAFRVSLLDPNGRERPLLQGGYGSAGAGVIEGRWVWLIDTPGRYELRVAYELGELRRVVEAR
jgi:hypothetical protein